MWSGQQDMNIFKLWSQQRTSTCVVAQLCQSPEACALHSAWLCVSDRIGSPSAPAPLLFNQALGLHGEKTAVFLKAPSRSKIYSENLLILQALVNGTDTSFFSFLGNLKRFLWIYISLSLKAVVSAMNFKSPFWNSPCITLSLRAVREEDVYAASTVENNIIKKKEVTTEYRSLVISWNIIILHLFRSRLYKSRNHSY